MARNKNKGSGVKSDESLLRGMIDEQNKRNRKANQERRERESRVERGNWEGRQEAKSIGGEGIGMPTDFYKIPDESDEIAGKAMGGRMTYQEGSLMMPPEMEAPVDTYPNIPPEEMDEAMASQLPDDEMEEEYLGTIMDQALSPEEQEYLEGALSADPRLSEIIDKVVVTASEFTGEGEVSGPGTGVSDSIPARLSDGEFVITKKATDQIGADNLQRMMDNAERAYDGGYQRKALGGYMFDDPEQSETASPRTIDEEVKKAMIRSNKIPSLQ